MKTRLLSIIARGAKNSRYLIHIESGYRSVLLPNDKNYSIHNEVDIEETKIDNVNDKWVERYFSFSKTKERVLNHLSKYKENVLKIPEQGYWISISGERKWYTHILPDKLEKKNLIESEYFSSLEETYENIKKANNLHVAFKNLNSSQAFAFNFFQPIIDENLFIDLLDFWHDNSKPKCEFEKIDKEDKTQFDLFFSTNDRNCSFEIKYTEQNFGGAPIDKNHHTKWENIYKEKIATLCGKDTVSEEEFFENYQLWRNILFAANPRHDVCFLFPKFRNDLEEAVKSAREKCGQAKERISILYANEFVERILSDSKYSEKLKTHYAEFKQKYLEFDDINLNSEKSKR